MLLPTAIYFLLALTGLPSTLRLTLGGILVGAKAIGGRIETGQFRWRLAVAAAIAPAAALIGCHLAGVNDTTSMVAGAVAAAAIAVSDLLRTRLRSGRRQSVDGFALLVLIEVVASIVVTLINGDTRFLLARSSFYIALGGVYVLATTWTHRPFMREALKPVAANGDPHRAAKFDRVWEKSPQFRTIYRVITASLGAVLIADAALRVAVIYSYPADQVGRSSLASQLPLPILIAIWFALNRGLAVPRAQRLLDAEMSATPEPSTADTTT